MNRIPYYFDAWNQGLIVMHLNMNKYNLPCNEGRIYKENYK